jgi:hypothetical protein
MDVISPILPSLPVEPTPPPMEYFPIDIPTPSPSPIYFEPSPVFYEPTPIYQPEPAPIYEPEPVIAPEPSVYYQEPTPVLGDSGSYYIPELIGDGGGGLYDFISNQLWLGNLTLSEAESYMAIDTTTKDTSDQA